MVQGPGAKASESTAEAVEEAEVEAERGDVDQRAVVPR